MKLIDTNWDKRITSKEIDRLLSTYDDGELFVEEVFSENILLDDNKIKSSTFNNDKGFGLRAVKKDEIKFYHSSEVNEDNLKKIDVGLIFPPDNLGSLPSRVYLI